MTCECINTVNEKLKSAGHNTKIKVPWIIPMPGEKQRGECCEVVTIKADEKVRVKPVSLMATYCPFCGTKFDQDETAPADQGTPS